MKVIVVGAGIGGLGAATLLAERGHDVEVIEAGERVGGRAVTLERPRTGDRCDAGTQYYHTSYVRALRFMRGVGIEKTLSTIRGSTRFFDLRVQGGSYLVGHRLPWFKPVGVAGNLGIGWQLASLLVRHRIDTFALENRPELDERRALDAIRDPATQELVVRTLHLAGALAEPTDVSLLQVLRLIRIIVFTDYLSLAGGTAALHQALAARLRVRLGTPVARVVVAGGRSVGVALEGSGAVLTAEHVVVATAAPGAARLLPAEWGDERTFLAGVRMPPALVVSYFLDRPLEKGVWSYFSRAGAGTKAAFWVDQSQKNPALVPSGKAILQAWICHPVAGEMEALADGAWSSTGP